MTLPPNRCRTVALCRGLCNPRTSQRPSDSPCAQLQNGCVFLLRWINRTRPRDSPNIQLNRTGFASGRKIMLCLLRGRNWNSPHDSTLITELNRLSKLQQNACFLLLRESNRNRPRYFLNLHNFETELNRACKWQWQSKYFWCRGTPAISRVTLHICN